VYKLRFQGAGARSKRRDPKLFEAKGKKIPRKNDEDKYVAEVA
jgi:hypothetical protein